MKPIPSPAASPAGRAFRFSVSDASSRSSARATSRQDALMVRVDRHLHPALAGPLIDHTSNGGPRVFDPLGLGAQLSRVRRLR